MVLGRGVNPRGDGRLLWPVVVAFLLVLNLLAPVVAADQKPGKNGKDAVVTAEPTSVAQTLRWELWRALLEIRLIP